MAEPMLISLKSWKLSGKLLENIALYMIQKIRGDYNNTSPTRFKNRFKPNLKVSFSRSNLIAAFMKKFQEKTCCFLKKQKAYVGISERLQIAWT